MLDIAAACVVIFFTVLRLVDIWRILRAENVTLPDYLAELRSYSPERVVDLLFTLRALAYTITAGALYLFNLLDSLAGLLLVAIAVALLLDLFAAEVLYVYARAMSERPPDVAPVLRAEAAQGAALILSAVLLVLVRLAQR